MDINNQQIAPEQKVVLRTLAESVAKSGCTFLEIGSWTGDSTVVLGKVAKRHDGHVFCIDWWKGSPKTSLKQIASKEDTFSYFWSRIRSEGLEDVVIPIRGRSDIASVILKEKMFDLIFIDGDHLYEGVFKDIQQYAPFVKREHGILCGHDCEGYLSDYEMVFLKEGKDIDFHESVHCGVVLAVGEVFKKYSIDWSIWSVRASKKKGYWKPTQLAFPELEQKKQQPPPPIAYSKNYTIYRYDKLIYAIPNSFEDVDVTVAGILERSDVIIANCIGELERLINETILLVDYTLLCEDSYKDFGIWKYRNKIYALAR